VISGALAVLLANPAMAQNATLEQVSREIAEIKAKNERLEAEVEYLKENAKAQRKEGAVAAADVATLKTSTGKFTWSGDFRFRDEEISTATSNTTPEHTRSRQRIRVRLGVLAKVTDTIGAKIQFSTTNTGNDTSRSTNQTLGSGWDRKALSIDQAYVDWKALDGLNLQLGKMPIPWTTTASYFWDKDLTPEGAALKFVRGPFFAGAYYNWLNERNVNNNQAASTDAKMAGIQVGWKQGIGKTTLTAAISYFDLTGVKDQIVAFSQTQTANLTSGAVSTTTCAIDGAFGAGVGTGNNSFGNTTYSGASAAVGNATSCTRLASDFNVLSALVQLDFPIGKFPATVFADYMKNNKAEINPTVNKTLDDAFAIGFTFGKASAAKSWEASLMYEKNGKDAVFAQFVDSDFGGGFTDAIGWAIKGGYAPATNWTLNATYFINKQNHEGDLSASAHDLDYKRLQLDLNYKF